MPKHVGVENLELINKNPPLPSAFVGLFANDCVIFRSNGKIIDNSMH
jgi:hypothetical protein